MMERIHGGFFPDETIEYDFSISVNPLGMPAKAREAIEIAISSAGKYPDPSGRQVKEAFVSYIKKRMGVCLNKEHLLLGNGAAELIYTLCFSVFSENHRKKGIVLGPTFSEYAYAVEEAGGEVVYIHTKEKNGFGLTDDEENVLVEEIKKGVEIVFVCNPNNPTGTLFEKERLLRILEICERTGTVFCVDECFMPFCDKWEKESLLAVIEKYSCLCVFRAMTKFYSMSGIRMGFLVSSNSEFLKKLRKRLQPWNTSVLAQNATVQALADESYVQKTRAWLTKEKAYLLDELQRLNLKVYKAGAANFLLFEADKDLQKNLFSHKIAVRSISEIQPENQIQTGFFRVGIRTHEENVKLVEALKQVLYK